jgi:hypothetical protein
MGATNTNVQAVREGIGGNADGVKVGIIRSHAYAAKNDTITVTNAQEILAAITFVDATNAVGTCTFATNVVTVTDATATAHTTIVWYI